MKHPNKREIPGIEPAPVYGWAVVYPGESFHVSDVRRLRSAAIKIAEQDFAEPWTKIRQRYGLTVQRVEVRLI